MSLSGSKFKPAFSHTHSQAPYPDGPRLHKTYYLLITVFYAVMFLLRMCFCYASSHPWIMNTLRIMFFLRTSPWKLNLEKLQREKGESSRWCLVFGGQWFALVFSSLCYRCLSFPGTTVSIGDLLVSGFIENYNAPGHSTEEAGVDKANWKQLRK